MSSNQTPRFGEEGEEYSLYAHEESVIRRAEDMLGKLEEVSGGVRDLAKAYRGGYRETARLVRISDRMQLDLHDANRTLTSQAEDLRRLNAALREEIERREQLEQELRRIASIDELTGTHTRRSLLELGEHELRRRARHGHSLAVLMMDLDHFKRINDSFGHAAGDQLLRDFGFLLRSSLRKGDIAGRFGGEEFLAI
ncbi:GGDEF domain-containing protein, partial [Thiorhodococcus mannitoliphagus]